jgi:periplasmic copper chaperone A
MAGSSATEEAGMRVWARVASGAAVALMLATGVSAQAAPSASDAWVAAPAAGATTAEAYVVVDNPTMYEIFVVSVTADIAGSAEIVQGDAGERVKELSVPSYGRTELKPGAVRIRLKDLKGPLKEGDSVPLTLTTEGGVILKIAAAVKKG